MFRRRSTAHLTIAGRACGNDQSSASQLSRKGKNRGNSAKTAAKGSTGAGSARFRSNHRRARPAYAHAATLTQRHARIRRAQAKRSSRPQGNVSKAACQTMQLNDSPCVAQSQGYGRRNQRRARTTRESARGTGREGAHRQRGSAPRARHWAATPWAARPSRLFFLPVNESGRVPRSPRRAAKTQTNAYSQGQPAAGRRGGTRDRSYVKLEVYTTRTGRPDDHSYRTICTCMVFRLSALRLSLPAPLLRHSANRAGALEPSIPGQQSGKCLRSARNLL